MTEPPKYDFTGRQLVGRLIGHASRLTHVPEDMIRSPSLKQEVIAARYGVILVASKKGRNAVIIGKALRIADGTVRQGRRRARKLHDGSAVFRAYCTELEGLIDGE